MREIAACRITSWQSGSRPIATESPVIVSVHSLPFPAAITTDARALTRGESGAVRSSSTAIRLGVVVLPRGVPKGRGVPGSNAILPPDGNAARRHRHDRTAGLWISDPRGAGGVVRA